MNPTAPLTWIAFASSKRIASGTPHDVAAQVKAYVDSHEHASVMLFEEATSRPVELDLRGSLAAVLQRLEHNLSSPDPAQPAKAPTAAPRPPGRPRLGVTSREVTLLPRHWEWLAAQPGGASVALRKLVDRVQRAELEQDRAAQAAEAASRFMGAIASQQPGFEDASRALAALDLPRLREAVASWPPDVQKHVLFLAEAAVEAAAETGGDAAG